MKRFYSLKLPLVAYREGPLAVASRLGRTRATSLEVGPWSGSDRRIRGSFADRLRAPAAPHPAHLLRPSHRLELQLLLEGTTYKSVCLATQDNGRGKSALICDVMEIWLKEHGYLK